MAEALDRVRRKLEELRDQGKRFRKEGRDTVYSARQKPGERALERKGPIRRFIEERERPIMKQLKQSGPLRRILERNE